MANKKLIGELLLGKGMITLEQLKEALERQQRTKEFLGQILLENKQIKEKDLLEVLSEQFNISCVELKDKYIHWDLIKRFSPSLILDYKCIPLDSDDNSVTVAISNPMDAWTLSEAEREVSPLELKLVLTSAGDIEEVIRRYKQYMKAEIKKKLE